MFRELKNFTIVYYLLVLVFMLSVFMELQALHYLVKPMFMLALIGFQYVQLKGNYSFFSKMVLIGLILSWVGDVALMIDEKFPILFIVGLGAFLIAHLGYTAGFVQSIKASKSPLKWVKSLLIALPFVAFTAAFFSYVQSGLPADLYVPVLAYTIVITIMGITATARHYHTDKKSFKWIAIGAILFILSDCVIAINKFVYDFEYDAIVNMILYLGGQYMITVGAVYYAKSLSSELTDS